MADNITAPASGSVLATDDIGGVHYPRTKISIGEDGSASDVSADNPLPVEGAVTIATPVAVTGAFWQATQPVSIAGTVTVSGPLTDTQLRATPVPVSGTVAVTGTFYQATQPVSAAALPLPSGASTAANQTTIIGHVDGIETLLGTLGTQTTLAAILAKLIAAPATEAKQDSTISAINGLTGAEYETVAAGQTTQALGATGATGDLLTGVLIIPATTSPGAVQIKDGSGTAITVFAGGADSVSTLHPFFVPLGIRSGSGAWQITTGANVSAIGTGDFT